MRAVCIVSLVIVAAMAAPADDKPYYNVADAPALFEKYIQDYNKVYKDDADREEHYQAFVESLKVINQSNADNPLTTFDLNQFSDYTDSERKSMTGLLAE